MVQFDVSTKRFSWLVAAVAVALLAAGAPVAGDGGAGRAATTSEAQALPCELGRSSEPGVEASASPALSVFPIGLEPMLFAMPPTHRTCVCSCGAPCTTDADCGPGGRCGSGITCCAAPGPTEGGGPTSREGEQPVSDARPTVS